MSYSNLIAELSTSVDQGIFTGKKSAINHEEMHYGPENKRACPCDTCPLYEACAKEVLSVLPCVIGVLRETQGQGYTEVTMDILS